MNEIELTCAACGSNLLHLRSASVTVGESTGREDLDVALRFHCENCLQSTSKVVHTHKGTTFVSNPG